MKSISPERTLCNPLRAKNLNYASSYCCMCTVISPLVNLQHLHIILGRGHTTDFPFRLGKWIGSMGSLCTTDSSGTRWIPLGSYGIHQEPLPSAMQRLPHCPSTLVFLLRKTEAKNSSVPAFTCISIVSAKY